MRRSAWRLAMGFVLAAKVAFAAVVPGVSFEQRVGETLPLDAEFRDTDGNLRPLGAWFRDRPVVLWFGYARCPQLCSVVSDGMVSALRPLQASAGIDFDVLMITIDPAETAAEARASRAEAVGHYGRESAGRGWHYLTGGEAAIREVTAAAGFHFIYDPRSRQYAHPSGLLVLTPQGRISSYFPGLDFAPKALASAIDRAGSGGIGEKTADLLIACFRGDGISGRYGKIIWRTLGVAVGLTVVALGAGIGGMLWSERRARRPGGEGGAP
ncbi:MAG TPA: SCO family protein [Opitutaceae bacterium]|nr:SCO family protein [Opitutaceae bacterium]